MRRIPGLDGVRGLAALCILATHMRILPLFVALNLFFGLSGFLITWLLLEEERVTGAVSLRHFYLRRVLRLMPAYYVALFIISVAVPPSAGPLRADHLWSTALYYSNYYQAVHGATHGSLSPYWSLAIEEQFYLLWPLCFIAVRRHRIALLVVVILAVWWQRAVVVWGEGRMEWAYHAMDCRADHLLVGCLVAVLLHRGHVSRLWHSVCGGPWRLWMTITALFGLTLLPLVTGEELREGATFYVEPWFIGIFFIQVVAGRAEGRWAWLDSAWLRWLGQRSYAFYLYHMFALDLVGRFVTGSRFLLFFPSLALALLMAQCSWILIEGPIQRWKDRWNPLTRTLSP
jgi:peptidoglycan/LPS O-acetylase OafA/YrhL